MPPRTTVLNLVFQGGGDYPYPEQTGTAPHTSLVSMKLLCDDSGIFGNDRRLMLCTFPKLLYVWSNERS